MDQTMGLIVFGLVAAWLVYMVYQGFNAETSPKMVLAESDNGLKVPVCASCRVPLVATTQREGGLASLVGGLLLLIGFVALFFSLIGGLVLLAVGLIVNVAGKRQVTVMKCPSCGVSAQRLD